MATVHKALSAEQGTHAVYCGDGRYLSCFSVSARQSDVHIGMRDGAAEMTRGEAVAACHVVRRAGLPAWVVGVTS